MANPQGIDKSGGSPVLWAAAAAAIGYGLTISDGIFDPNGLMWLAAGILLAGAGLLVNWGHRLAWIICLAGVAPQMVAAGALEMGAPAALRTVAFPILGGAALAALWRPRLFVPVLLAAHVAVGVWVLRQTPTPLIDVYEVTKDACLALEKGHNPYAIDFPELYAGHPDWEKSFYAPGTIYGGRTHFGYPYMPLSLLLACLGQAIAGDFRFAHLLAITAAGGLMAYARPGRLATAAACLFLLSPVGFFVVEYGWSEPAMIVCMAAVVFCAARLPAALPWMVGLFLVSKQHMPMAAPAVLLLIPRPWSWRKVWQFGWKAVVIGTLVTLPMLLWDFPAFWHSAVGMQLHDPFRMDSLNFAAAWARTGHAPPPQWLAFGAAIVAMAVAVGRGPRTASGFAAAVAVIYLSFFALSKQAFCNYYYFTFAALCGAVAAAEARVSAEIL